MISNSVEGGLKEKIERDIAKYFENDGGGIEVVSYDIGTNILKVKMLGKCSGCPSAIVEIEEIFLEMIQKDFPRVKKIQVLNEVSEDLLNFAKKILTKN